MRQVFSEVWRVLRDDGTLWLNLGDSYINHPASAVNRNGMTGSLNNGVSDFPCRKGTRGDQKRTQIPAGLKPKDIAGIPWMVAFALRDAGWYLRQDIIWNKLNPMPESITDRCTKAHEYIFLLTKSPSYFYDHEAIKEPSLESDWESRLTRESEKSSPTEKVNGIRTRSTFGNRDGQLDRLHSGKQYVEKGVRNKRDVWTVPTSPYPEAHFATFPPDLIKPCVLAGTKPGDTVLDPFFGSGTTGMVSLELGRSCIGIELNPDYVSLAEQRCNVTPGFAL